MPTNQNRDAVYIRNRDAVYIRNLDGYTAFAYPPVYIKATTENIPARFDGAEFSKDEAETLARTIAPQLFSQEGTEPWRTPIREIHKDLKETVQSYGRDLRAAEERPWDLDSVLQSMAGLLEALQGTLDRLENLL